MLARLRTPARNFRPFLQPPISPANRFQQENATNLTIRSAIRPPRGAVAVYAPSRGRVEVLRSGQPGKDAGLAAPGHGWPMAAGPRSRTGARACRATARHRTKGAKALGYFALFKVTRRKGGTNTRHPQKNGYPPNPPSESNHTI